MIIRSTITPLSITGWRFTAANAPVLVLGGSGRLGRRILHDCESRGILTVAPSRGELDLTSQLAVREHIWRIQPWAVINAIGYADVDAAEDDEANCRLANATIPGMLAAECAAARIPFVTFSSDLVFDGNKRTPYDEADAPMPLSVFGCTKAEGERLVSAAHPGALVIRTSALFGPDDSENFAAQCADALAAGETVNAARDVMVSPTYIPDLVREMLDLLVDQAGGLWHLANQGRVSWSSFAVAAARAAGVDDVGVSGLTAPEMAWRATRPRNSSLTSCHGQLLPTLVDALVRWAPAWRAAQATAAATVEPPILHRIGVRSA